MRALYGKTPIPQRTIAWTLPQWTSAAFFLLPTVLDLLRFVNPLKLTPLLERRELKLVKSHIRDHILLLDVRFGSKPWRISKVVLARLLAHGHIRHPTR